MASKKPGSQIPAAKVGGVNKSSACWFEHRSDIPVEERYRFMGEANNGRDILAIGEGDLGFAIQARGGNFQPSCSFRILLLRPGSPSATSRAGLEPRPLAEFQKLHKENVQRWLDVSEKLLRTATKRGIPYYQHCVRLYNEDPSVALLRADDNAYVTYYVVGFLGDQSPTALYKSSDLRFAEFTGLFERLWKSASSALAWLIVSDFDGVLGHVSGGTATEEDLKAWDHIHRYIGEANKRYASRLGRKSGRDRVPSLPVMTICTGRDASFVRNPLAQMGLPLGIPCVCESGAVFLDAPDADVPSRVNPMISPQALDHLKAAKKELEKRGVSRVPQTKDVVVTLNADKATGETPEALARLATEKLKAAGFEVLGKAKLRISKSDLGQRRCVFITYGGDALDILPVVEEQGTDGKLYVVGLTKEHGIKEIARSLAEKWSSQEEPLTPEDVLRHTVAMGDSMGDMPMFENVGLPACPFNADQRIKDYFVVSGKCAYVAAGTTVKGAQEIIEHYSGAHWDGKKWKD